MNLTAKDIAKALDITVQHARRIAGKESWPFDARRNPKGGGLQRLYPLRTLPDGVKEKIILSLKNGGGIAAGAKRPRDGSPGESSLPGGAAAAPAKEVSAPENLLVGASPALPSPAQKGAAPCAGEPSSRAGLESPAYPLRPRNGRPVDFSLAPPEAQKKARTWARIIRAAGEALDRADRTRALDHFVASYNAGHVDHGLLGESGEISRGTFYRKFSAFEQGGLAALLPAHRGRGRDIHPDVEKKAITYFLDRARKARRIYEYLKEEFPAKIVPSYSSLVRFLNAWAGAHPQEVCLAHWGKSRWKSRFGPAFGSASEDAPYPNHTWEIDSTVADIITKDGRRWKLVACVDVFSTICTAITMQPKSNAWGIVQTFARGFGKYGIPERVKKDNGKDYASAWVNRFLRDMGVETPKLPVRAPEKKPHVERFFGILTGRLFSELTGYTGNSVLTRPEEIHLDYTSEDLDGIIQRWVEHEHNESVNSTFNQVRRERFFQPGLRLRKVSGEELELLTHPVSVRKVNKKGISLNGMTYRAPELIALVGQRVEARLDVDDVSRITVFFKKELYCTARNSAAADWGLDRYIEEKRSAGRALKQAIKAEKELAKGGVRERMLDHLDGKEAEAPARFPAPIEVESIIDVSKCSVREEKEKTPYDDFPEKIDTPLRYDEGWRNYQWLLKAEVLGVPIMPSARDWMHRYVNGKIEGLEREWWNMFGRYKNDPTTASTFEAELDMLKKYVAEHGTKTAEVQKTGGGEG